MISVCITTYNDEKFLKEQIDFILKQLSSNDEIIVSDDGSKDATCENVRAINDDRIKMYQNCGTYGFTHNFKNAISKTKGEYIFLSDQDDVWKDNKMNVTMQDLASHDFVISDCINVDENMSVIQDSRLKAFDIKAGFMRHSIKSHFLGCCMALRRNVLEASLPFPKNDSLLEHDIWLATVAFFCFDTVLINESLIYYRRHGYKTFAVGFEKGYSLFNKLYRRIYRIVCLTQIAMKVRNLKASSNAKSTGGDCLISKTIVILWRVMCSTDPIYRNVGGGVA